MAYANEMANMNDLRLATRTISNDLIMFKHERYFVKDGVLTVELEWFNIGHLGRREFLDAIKSDIARYYSLYGNCIGPATCDVSYKSRFSTRVVFVEWGAVPVFKMDFFYGENKMYGMDAIVKGLNNDEILNQINANVRLQPFNFDPIDDVWDDDERIDPDDDEVLNQINANVRLQPFNFDPIDDVWDDDDDEIIDPDDDEIESFQLVIDFEYSDLVTNCLNDVVYEARRRAHKRIFKDEIQDELMIVTWHPDRFLDWCVDIEELKFLEELWRVEC